MARKLYDKLLQTLTQPYDDIETMLAETADEDSRYAAFDAVTAVVHHRSRMDEATLAFFEANGWLDEEGLSRSCYDDSMLDALCSHLPAACKRVAALWCDTKPETWCYLPKYEQDKWKKLEDRCGIVATVETAHYKDDDTARAETALRDLIRSAKEIPSLKPHPLVWVAQAPKALGLERLAKHYFSDYRVVATEAYERVVAFHPNLGKLDMRTFIYPPSQGERR